MRRRRAANTEHATPHPSHQPHPREEREERGSVPAGAKKKRKEGAEEQREELPPSSLRSCKENIHASTHTSILADRKKKWMNMRREVRSL